jgi:hypothetical protein
MTEASSYSSQRRSPRVAAVKRVDVEWRRKDGLRVRESAETEVVSAHGALLRLGVQIRPQTELILKELTTHQSVPARVVRVSPPAPDGIARLAVELATPSETFWGLTERRGAPRYQIKPETFAYFYPADEDSTGLVRDLSLGGVYIEDEVNQLREGAELELELLTEGEKLCLRGVVARTYPHKGFALRFLDYSVKLKERLENYLRNAAGTQG